VAGWQPIQLIRLCSRLSVLEDAFNGERKYPLRTWWFRYHPDRSFEGSVWSVHDHTGSDFAAWIAGDPTGFTVIAGHSFDCEWVYEEDAKNAESSVRESWHNAGRDLRLPPFDGTALGWTVAAEAEDVKGAWTDVSNRDPSLRELGRLFPDEIFSAGPGSFVGDWKHIHPNTPAQHQAAYRLFSGDALSSDDHEALAVAIRPERVVELLKETGYDRFRETASEASG